MSTQAHQDAVATPVPPTAITHRPAAARGHADHGWLKSAHSFSFANYHDPSNIHFEGLRVINDDWIAPGGGFPMHPHQDFEIFSYVLDGAIAHEDSMGNGSTVTGGGVQYMTAGTGVRHSEFNPSRTDATHMLQIWLLPKVRGAQPRYEVKELSDEDKRGKLALFVAEDGRDGAIQTLAGADVYAGFFDGDERTTFTLQSGRKAYVHAARGAITVAGQRLEAGDALTVSAPGTIEIGDGTGAEILLFDLESLS